MFLLKKNRKRIGAKKVANRIAARVDANHGEIKKAFISLGCSVSDTSGAGKGFPDIVVGYKGITVLVEIKDGEKTPSQRKLTKDQIIFHGNFTGAIAVVKDVDDVLKIYNKLIMNEISFRHYWKLDNGY